MEETAKEKLKSNLMMGHLLAFAGGVLFMYLHPTFAEWYFALLFSIGIAFGIFYIAMWNVERCFKEEEV